MYRPRIIKPCRVRIALPWLDIEVEGTHWLEAVMRQLNRFTNREYSIDLIVPNNAIKPLLNCLRRNRGGDKFNLTPWNRDRPENIEESDEEEFEMMGFSTSESDSSSDDE